MAYASLVVVTKVIDQILPIDQAYSFIRTKDQMSSLREKFVCFQEFFEHISGLPRSSEVDELESRIRDAAYKMEDMVESILIRPFGQEDGPEDKDEVEDDDAAKDIDEDEEEVDLQSFSIPTTAEFASCFEQVDFLLREAMEMKKVLNNKIISRTSIYSHNIATSSPRGSLGATATKVGLDEQFTRILRRVTRTPATFQVVPITGMGGIGKTTLARSVFEDPRTKNRFDIRLWATVSQEFNVKQILQGFLPEKEEHEGTIGELIVKVHQILKGRRYLIILDDVWEEKVWDGVRNDNNYSRVVLTTRLSKVATYVSSPSDVHQMELLSEERSWDLLRVTVYGHEAGCPGEFEDIGRTILRSCKGLPLALVVIGGLLKFNMAKDYWEEVAASTATKASMNESLLGVLSLSYTNLPPHLKACFLHLGSFPEDKEISTKELVKLWSAEGFLKPSESKSIEEVAEECLKELVDRSLVLVVKKRYNGNIKTSRIHDVLRDLSLKQAQKEKLVYCHGSTEIDRVSFQGIIEDQHRRVSFTEFSPTCSISFYSLVRSFQTEYMNDDKLSTIGHLKLLRVLKKVNMLNILLSDICLD